MHVHDSIRSFLVFKTEIGCILCEVGAGSKIWLTIEKKSRIIDCNYGISTIVDCHEGYEDPVGE